MISAYQSIINHSGGDWDEFLDETGLIDVFKPLVSAYQDKSKLGCAIKYIAYCYSQESSRIILGTDWQKNKQSVFEFVMAKPEKGLYEELVLLKSDHVIDAANRWLDLNESDTFKQLSVLKDLRVEMQISAVSLIRKASLEVDYDQKMKNAEYANKLKGMINDLEKELIQNSKELKEAVQEVRKSRKSTDTVGVEHFAK